MLKENHKIFEDVLDDEFFDIFKPIFYFLTPFGMRGVTFKYKFVTPPTLPYKTYCFTIWILNYVCLVNSVTNCNYLFDTQQTLPLKVGFLMNGAINAFLALKTVFCNGHVNTQLYVKLQRIERVLRMKDYRKINKKLAKTTATATMCALLAFLVFLLLFNLYFIEGFCPTATIACAMSSISYIEMLLITTVLYFLIIRARYVNEVLSQKEHSFRTTKIYTCSISENEIVSDEILRGVCCILDSLADVMDVFQHAILLFALQMLVWQLISIQNLVTSMKQQMPVSIPVFLSTIPSTVAFTVIMLVMCFVSQSLTTCLERTKQLCTKFTLSYEGKSRGNAKRLILILNGKREITIYDIFTLNTRLPLHLFALTASYTIVLLQFAVL